tara:strand:+ start:16321 stop:17175 length:855 start_codon:yes stop_codon:yes gene_type:complete
MQKLSFVDVWKRIKDFEPGDLVSLLSDRNGDVLGAVGQVTSVMDGIAFMDVEFPWGNRRVSPEEVVKVNPNTAKYLPPTTDSSYSSYDKTARMVHRLAGDYMHTQDQLTQAADTYKYNGFTTTETLHALAAAQAPKHMINAAVKTALYWHGEGRQYRMNKGEIDDGLPNCPTCKCNMQKTTYKKYTKLFVCPECLFCIKPGDIEGLPTSISESDFGPGARVASDTPVMALVQSGCKGSESIREQFASDLGEYGLSDAVMLLSSHAVEGNFDADIYNDLVALVTE